VAVGPDVLYFNSNMVRLKVPADRDTAVQSPLFQFQYGSIKRKLKKDIQTYLHIFQFQYGSIKSKLLRLFSVLSTYFNSNMVRLKAFL